MVELHQEGSAPAASKNTTSGERKKIWRSSLQELEEGPRIGLYLHIEKHQRDYLLMIASDVYDQLNVKEYNVKVLVSYLIRFRRDSIFIIFVSLGYFVCLGECPLIMNYIYIYKTNIDSFLP